MRSASSRRRSTPSTRHFTTNIWTETGGLYSCGRGSSWATCSRLTQRNGIGLSSSTRAGRTTTSTCFWTTACTMQYNRSPQAWLLNRSGKISLSRSFWRAWRSSQATAPLSGPASSWSTRASMCRSTCHRTRLCTRSPAQRMRMTKMGRTTGPTTNPRGCASQRSCYRSATVKKRFVTSRATMTTSTTSVRREIQVRASRAATTYARQPTRARPPNLAALTQSTWPGRRSLTRNSLSLLARQPVARLISRATTSVRLQASQKASGAFSLAPGRSQTRATSRVAWTWAL